MTDSTKINGFTPAPDVLIMNYSLTTAAVYGKYWRFWRRYGKAQAPQNLIAQQLNISDRTLRTHLKTLVEDKYLEDLTPDWKGVPHIYVPTPKLQMETVVQVTHEGEVVDQDAPPIEPDMLSTKEKISAHNNIGQNGSAEKISGLNNKPRKKFPESAEKISVKYTDTKEDSNGASAGAPICFVCRSEEISEDGQFRDEDGEVRERCDTCFILGMTEPKPQQVRTNGLTLDQRKARVAEAMQNGAIAAEKDDLKARVSDYPPDVQDLLYFFCKATKIPLPAWKNGKNGQAKYWVNGARQLSDASAPYGLDAIRSYLKVYAEEMEDNDGRPPHALDSPNSLVNKVRGHVGHLRRTANAA